jgi:hypothetical protein
MMTPKIFDEFANILTGMYNGRFNEVHSNMKTLDERPSQRSSSLPPAAWNQDWTTPQETTPLLNNILEA